MSDPNKKWNEIIDSATRTLSHAELKLGVPVTFADFASADFRAYVERGKLPFTTQPPHKKALEFYFSFKLLNPLPAHHFMDLAGGRSAYLASLRLVRGCSHLYLNDHIFNGVRTDENGVTIAGGDASRVQLPDASLDRISCHHAFEHFQGDTDTNVMREIGRLLKPGGIACIIPLFLAEKFIECWNVPHEGTFDPAATLVLDPSASIPGADDDGHFARFYSLEALSRRVLAVAKQSGLSPRIAVCRLDGQDLPDMKANFGSILNFPLRALVLKKTG